MIDESLLAKVSSLPGDRLELIGLVWNALSLNDLPVGHAERAVLLCSTGLYGTQPERSIPMAGS
ncbi:MAG TPA: hypothetical protein VN476_06525 [Pyrinomonadaceae bacterium]|nr:hypothetical protein [Pyrinomonadaceae bacterium]